jgi:hypothetical protein
MVYDVFWSFVVFAILAGSIMLIGIRNGPSDRENSKEDNNKKTL